MSNVKFKLNSAGIREMLKSSDVQSMISEVGTKVVTRAGEGYELKTSIRPTRVVATIAPNTVKAHFDNLKHNVLLKALGSGKG